MGDIQNVLSIGKECGPGYLEIWSPDCFCTWVITQSEDGRADPITLRTGPASKAGVYLPRGGEAAVECVFVYPNEVNEYNGFIERAAAAPEVRAKFYPGLSHRPKIQPQRFVLIGPAGPDRPPIPPAITEDVAFPPHYCFTAVVSCDQNIQVDVVNAFDGLTRQIRAVSQTPLGAVPFVVGDWEFIAITGQQTPVQAQIVWSENLQIEF